MRYIKMFFFLAISLVILNGLFFTAQASYSGKDIKSAGANINIIAEDVKNIYTAGARVSIESNTKENIYVAGALIDINTETNGNLYAAGSRINVNGKILGEARLAGAELIINAEIGDVLGAAAASIEINKTAKLPPNSSLAAALIEFRGTANDNLSLYAEEVIFSGHATGVVTIEGRNVELDETAHIEGNLIIRSSEEALISPNATILGKLTQTGLENSEFFKEYDEDSDTHGFFLLVTTSVFLLGLVLIIFARDHVEQAITLARTQPGQSILWGLIIFFGILIFVTMIMVTIIGIPLGIAILLSLPFLLILGLTTSILGFSDWILNKNSEPKKTGQRLLLLVAGTLILIIIGFVPFIGGVIILLALLYGLGAAAITLSHSLSRKSI